MQQRFVFFSRQRRWNEIVGEGGEKKTNVFLMRVVERKGRLGLGGGGCQRG